MEWSAAATGAEPAVAEAPGDGAASSSPYPHLLRKGFMPVASYPTLVRRALNEAIKLGAAAFAQRANDLAYGIALCPDRASESAELARDLKLDLDALARTVDAEIRDLRAAEGTVPATAQATSEPMTIGDTPVGTGQAPPPLVEGEGEAGGAAPPAPTAWPAPGDEQSQTHVE